MQFCRTCRCYRGDLKNTHLQFHASNGIEPFKGTKPPDLLEFQIEAYAKLFAASSECDVEAPCRSCGRIALSKPVRIVIDQSSVPNNLDLFRGQDFTTLILATERFVEVAQKLNLTGIRFHEVEI